MNHYLFKFNQAAEDRVRRNAERYSIEVIAPKVSVWRKTRKARKPQPTWVPAFHSYIVLGFDEAQLIYALTKLHRSIRPVMMTCPDGGLALGRVSAREVARIQDSREFRKTDPPKTEPDPKYKLNELVRILGGAATGLKGKIIIADPDKRQAQVEMENWPAKLTVSYELLERAA